MDRIFISYKRCDKDLVYAIRNKIERSLNETCWIDVEGIESDAQFINVIMSAIERSEIVLFMYSKSHSEITDFEEVVRLDTQYINNWSLWLEIKILFKTVGAVLKKEGSM